MTATTASGAGRDDDRSFEGGVGEEYILSRSGKAVNIVSPANQGRGVIEVNVEDFLAAAAWLTRACAAAAPEQARGGGGWEATAREWAHTMVRVKDTLGPNGALITWSNHTGTCGFGLQACGINNEWRWAAEMQGHLFAALLAAHSAGDAQGYARGVRDGHEQYRKGAVPVGEPMKAPPFKLEVDDDAAPAPADPPTALELARAVFDKWSEEGPGLVPKIAAAIVADRARRQPAPAPATESSPVFDRFNSTPWDAAMAVRPTPTPASAFEGAGAVNVTGGVPSEVADDPLAALEEWRAAHKSRTVKIDYSDGFWTAKLSAGSIVAGMDCDNLSRAICRALARWKETAPAQPATGGLAPAAEREGK